MTARSRGQTASWLTRAPTTGAVRSVLLALCLALSVGVARASADIRSGRVDDPIDAQDTQPSLNPKPTYTELVAASTSYDQATGQVTVSVTFNQPAPDDTLAVQGNIMGPRSCLDRNDTEDPVPALGFTLGSAPPASRTGPRAAQFTVGLYGYSGEITGTATASDDGRTLTGTATHSAFAGRDWRCVSGTQEPIGPYVDDFGFYFDGYQPAELTPSSARHALTAELVRRYGPKAVAPGSWLKCPSQESFPDGFDTNVDPPQPAQLCEFRFRDGARWAHGSATVKLVYADLKVRQPSIYARFSKRMVSCRRLRDLRRYGIVDRRLTADGWIGCHDNPASMIRDLHYLRPGIRRIAFHGTNRAGFEDAILFRCVLRARARGRRTARCSNRLGDRFTYSWRVVPGGD
jgi:hypothetical protein